MRNKGLSAEAIGAALLAENQVRCDPPLGSREVKSIAKSAAQCLVTDVAEGPRFRIFSDKELLTLPDPEWCVHGFLPQGGLVVLYGRPGSAKSFVGLDWAMHVATGRAWNGHEVRCGLVLYVVAEGGTSFKIRIEAWLKFHGVRPPTGAFFQLEAVDLMDWDLVGVLVEEVTARMAGPPVLVVFDTLARSMAGGDENKQQDMGAAVAGADRVRHETGATVLFPHHTRRADEEERGSSVLRGAADAMFYVKNELGAVTLDCRKMKDAEPTSRTLLKLTKTADSCVVEPDPYRTLSLKERVFDYVWRHPGCGQRDIRSAVKGNWKSLAKALKELEAERQMWNDGTDAKQRWFVHYVDLED
jgi:hypothetical protein